MNEPKPFGLIINLIEGEPDDQPNGQHFITLATFEKALAVLAESQSLDSITEAAGYHPALVRVAERIARAERERDKANAQWRATGVVHHSAQEYTDWLRGECDKAVRERNEAHAQAEKSEAQLSQAEQRAQGAESDREALLHEQGITVERLALLPFDRRTRRVIDEAATLNNAIRADRLRAIERAEAAERERDEARELVTAGHREIERLAEAREGQLRTTLKKIENYFSVEESPLYHLWENGDICSWDDNPRERWVEVLDDLRNFKMPTLQIGMGVEWDAVMIYREVLAALAQPSVDLDGQGLTWPENKKRVLGAVKLEESHAQPSEVERLREAGMRYLQAEYSDPDSLLTDNQLAEIDWPARDFYLELRGKEVKK